MNPLKPKTTCERCFGAREVTKPAHEFTFMKRIFMARPEQVACPECSVAVVRAVRTDNRSGQVSIVRARLECRFRDAQPVVSLTEGGVTGGESVYADEYFLSCSPRNGWCACAGTPGRWDRLFVPAKEMRAALESLGLA